jgi:hypothetical protein
MKNKLYVFSVVVMSIFFMTTSCGVKKMNEADMVIDLPADYSAMDIVTVLRNNGYEIEDSSSNEIKTDWKQTKVELTTFRVELMQGVNSWRMKGKVKYEAFRDREMDRSVFTEKYVYPNSDIFVIKYGWDMLTKIKKDLSNDGY